MKMDIKRIRIKIVSMIKRKKIRVDIKMDNRINKDRVE